MISVEISGLAEIQKFIALTEKPLPIAEMAETTRSDLKSEWRGKGYENLPETLRIKKINANETWLYPDGKIGKTKAQDIVKFLQGGTQAHGPANSQALRFKPKGSSKFVYAKWVRGITPRDTFHIPEICYGKFNLILASHFGRH